jgi:hypothetical protein
VGRIERLLGRFDLERLADLVAAAAYGTLLVLAALSVVGIAQVSVGYGAELVAGVGVATWVAHVFAELLGGHVHLQRPLERPEVTRALIDGVPILAAPVLPACALLLGRLDGVPENTARTAAICIAIVQLLMVGVAVGQVAPARRLAAWAFGATTVGIGVAVVAVTITLGH